MNAEKALALLRSLPGHVGFYYRDTVTGTEIAFHASDPVDAASVIKLPVMAEAFRQREAGLLSFDEKVTIRREDKMPSCGALTYMRDGLTVTLGDLVTLMVILSDNTAANLLIRRLGIESINATAAALGCGEGTMLRRPLFRPDLSALGIRNTVSARDMGLFLGRLLEGTNVSAEASEEMLGILKNQRLNGKMPFYLKPRGILCAHKTGEDDAVTHDVGIIYAATPRIFCFLSEGTDVPMAERALQDLALMAALDDQR